MEYIEHKILKQKKLDLSCWGEWFDSEFVERHFCIKKEDRDRLEINDSAILKTVPNEQYHQRWSLLKVWLADEQEVYDEEAEEIGDVISSSSMTIRFCPICGEKLK